jgi:transcriptional regulator GlxA family with amidase domain
VTNTAPFIEYDAADRRDVQVAILVCPGFAPVDIIGLHTIFGLLPGAQVHLVWKNLDDIVGMPVFPTRATTTFTDCPTDVDVLFTGAVMPDIFDDEETLAFLAERGAHARWIGAACAGSLLLGAAGLLRGYRATTNFHHHDLLARFGAIPTRGNVVEDRNRITAGPFTGGVEIALRLVQDLYGDDLAMEMELQGEYAPTPPFGVGTPELAGPELTQRALARGAAFNEVVVAAVDRAVQRLEATTSAA